MDNAVKFSRERAVCRMEFTVRREAGHAILSLSDEGVGFPAEHAHRLFKPFQRLDPNKQYSGAGIGLAIVERIAALHGGSGSGRNRQAVGAVFEVKLPLVYCGAHGRRQRQSCRTRPGNPPRLACGLQRNSGTSASLTLTIEAIFTALLARAWYGEALDRRSPG